MAFGQVEEMVFAASLRKIKVAMFTLASRKRKVVKKIVPDMAIVWNPK